MDKKKRYLIAIASSGFGMVIVLSSHIAALMSVLHLGFYAASVQSLGSFFSNPIGSLFLILPYAFLGFYLSSKKKRDLIYTVPLVLLIIYYFYRHHRAEVLMTEKYWTAAALNIGLLPFHSAFLILVCFGIKHLILEIRKGI